MALCVVNSLGLNMTPLQKPVDRGVHTEIGALFPIPRIRALVRILPISWKQARCLPVVLSQEL